MCSARRRRKEEEEVGERRRRVAGLDGMLKVMLTLVVPVSV